MHYPLLKSKKLKNIIKLVYSWVPFKKELFSLIKVFGTPPPSFYQHLHFKGEIKVKVENKTFQLNHHGFQIENEIFWEGLTGGWEKVSIGLWIELCKRSTCIIDVGANTGVYALIAKALNPDAKVYAFEPVRRVYEKLVQNNELNKFDISCEELALSNFDGDAVIYDHPSEHIYSVTVNKNLSDTAVAVIPTQIKVKKLATYIEENNLPDIDLIKIDVETHEEEVLQGFEPYLSRMRPTMLIEILNDEVGKKVERILRGKDYLYFNIDEVNPPKQAQHITKSGYFNYLICREEVARDLGLQILHKPS